MDLTNYQLVFEDCFDSDTLDLSKWEYRASGARRCGFNAPEQVSVSDGKLYLKQEYQENGPYGPGWYAAMIRAKERFLRGYFEIRCICADPLQGNFWSAFWLQAEHSYEPELSRGGPGGAEIDIMEAFRAGDGTPGIDANIHVAGISGKPSSPGTLDSRNVVRVSIPDCYTAFHTYGCEWTENVYRFYIDRKLIGESSWGCGVSEVPEELILSLELPENTEIPADRTSTMTVDYVRVYQKK